MLFCYQLFPVCLFDEADCPERLEKQILSAHSGSLGTAVFFEERVSLFHRSQVAIPVPPRHGPTFLSRHGGAR